MTLLSSLQDWIKNKYIPIIYLILILYLFLIDFIVLILLDYQPKDITYLIDIDKIMYFNAFIITVFLLINFLVKKHFIATLTIIISLLSIYDFYFDKNMDNYIRVSTIIIIFMALLSYNVYKDNIESFFDDKPLILVIANIVIGLLISILIAICINNNLYNWNTIIGNTKLEFNKKISPHLIINTKSFNPIYLQKLNQDLKLFVNPTFIRKNLKQFYIKDNNKKFIIIPYDNKIINDLPITVYYYNVKNIKNIFIINPSTCANMKCELQTLITKAINKNDFSKGYQLISNYKHSVKIKK